MSLLLLVLLSAHAGEGMWMPEQVPSLASDLGELEIPPGQLADTMGDPLGAIVTLDWCSASFVSPDGLIATNHHCVGDYLQYNSSAEHDRAADGFLAHDRSEELWAGPGAQLYVVEQITDVTAQVLRGVGPRTKDRERHDRVERNKKAIVARCEKRPNRDCSVAMFYGGQQFRLIDRRALKDVRLVYAPPESVGSYGGEIDNWMWPRHAGDFSLLRAYVAPDGSTAEHAATNVPYKPPHWLRFDPTGAQEGEFVMVAGYPGSTYRYRSMVDLHFQADTAYPFKVALFTDALEVLRRHSDADPEARARLANPIDSLANGEKYYQGMVDAFARNGVVARKEAEHAALQEWVAADPARQTRYGAAMSELQVLELARFSTWKAEYLAEWLTRSSDLLATAHTAWRLASERVKQDLDRDEGYQDRDVADHRAAFERLDASLWLPSDRDLLKLVIERTQALPADARVEPVDRWVDAQGGVTKALDRLYDDPSAGKRDVRLAWLQRNRSELQASTDPWMELARALDQWLAPYREADKALDGARLRLEPAIMAARVEHGGGRVYPDANSTLRLTFGHVEGYSPQDGLLSLPRTRGAGVLAKAGDWPFDAPQRLLDRLPTAPASRWADPELKDVPVDFLTTLDTTGGNSGSATLNGKAQLVGLVFDGNYESMSADWVFDPAITRSIHVDVRYMLWLLDEVEQARWIVEELNLDSAPAAP